MSNRYTANFYCGPKTGTVKAEVYASTSAGAEEQIYAKYGNVQSIYDLTDRGSSSEGDGESGGGVGDIAGQAGVIGLLAVLIAAGWAIATFGAFLTGPLAGYGAYWGYKKVTGKDVDDYQDLASGQTKSIGAMIGVALILSSGIVGARIGHQAAADFNSSDSNVEEVRDN